MNSNSSKNMKNMKNLNELLSNLLETLVTYLPNTLDESKYRPKMFQTIQSEMLEIFKFQLEIKPVVNDLVFCVGMLKRGTNNDVTENYVNNLVNELANSLKELNSLYIKSKSKFSGQLNKEIEAFTKLLSNKNIKDLTYWTKSLFSI